ncbi:MULTISPECIES: hypothetical protein [Streptomyces]|uniref:Secreted protein n=1 Tax=Streptomyces hygroscopicus TaxID=1912 RepID=A0ABQ3U5X9_STRHY|nr:MULTISPECIES: hypothetical protein [Streptomyces]MBW8093125.1 hypothetical protein [Streptomyces hygroscopicus subsp. hygroscopicus]MDN3060380.1 hypothetical protein [Streptomyces sp. SRF1]GHJ31023.1 hypothetical protein TPA0910_54560 [Streptomyces hygroscopicus]
MSIRHTTKARRGAAATALAAALALAMAGCGSDGDDKPDDGAGRASTAAKDDGKQEPAVDSSKTIGQMKGPGGIVVTLHSAVRDDGGFVTVTGTVTNRGSQLFNAIDWRSKETEVKSQSSVSGASLIDEKGKKRYLVLRDTDGQCLCTTGLSGIKPNESRPLFAQFPAPPKSVTEVDFQIPTMPSVGITLSG